MLSLAAVAALSAGKCTKHVVDSERQFAGGDLEAPGVLEEFLSARSRVTPYYKHLIFLSVGDTRDHRRQSKDPALRTISSEFLFNLLANLRALNLGYHGILTTPALCKSLQEERCEFSCAWSTLWHNHPGLARWGLVPGDMFLIWQQQWRYVSAALERGYDVIRADTDVYFAESPYAVLNGPYFKDAAMVVQQDFGGPLGERPSCTRRKDERDDCGVHRGTALLNCGLVYVRSGPGGGAYHVINGTWARFVALLDGPPRKPPHLGGKPDPNALIDQQLMRDTVSALSVPLPDRSKPRDKWLVVAGDKHPTFYAAGTHKCTLAGMLRPVCKKQYKERAKAAHLVQYVAPPPDPTSIGPSVVRAERIALAPDWLFGRGCLTHVRSPRVLLEKATPGRAARTECLVPPTEYGLTMAAPGPAEHMLVATHFVYSMALKRKRSFRSFAWDLADKRPRANYSQGKCWDRSSKGILFGHTFFANTNTKYVLCAMPETDSPACACCAGLNPFQSSKIEMETTEGRPLINRNQLKAMAGCGDYQMFWDRR
uniref:Nucleotide-diphospho-sugar transferase domain-containing protein n=1 Tax=Emiliania huxleyi TaxID=2903 RepID=A0A7S3TJN7_EMIHU|mmetsp:Transcript_27767/g.82962  ORF Transcript_27767/g.82962 Transcript_27767/m.82962 type:complete len:541 (-) Transcript_27767:283-1905(-)